jgi:hypothetical protein
MLARCVPLWKNKGGVDDGIRTHDGRNHNPGLYQLSYVHRRLAILTHASWRARQDSNLQPPA